MATVEYELSNKILRCCNVWGSFETRRSYRSFLKLSTQAYFS